MNFTFAVSFIHISLDRDNRTSRNARCQVPSVSLRDTEGKGVALCADPDK